jgi:predicted RNase H-like HicB family nuclease
MGNVRYSVVVDWDKAEKLYIATVPALSVSTYGENREEAMEKVREAIAVTVEGLHAAGQPVAQGETHP